MKQIKIITNSDQDELEKEVNEWFANNQSVDIIDIKYIVSPGKYRSILIFYQIL